MNPIKLHSNPNERRVYKSEQLNSWILSRVLSSGLSLDLIESQKGYFNVILGSWVYGVLCFGMVLEIWEYGSMGLIMGVWD